jgi:virulence-associated protein VapD
MVCSRLPLRGPGSLAWQDYAAYETPYDDSQTQYYLLLQAYEDAQRSAAADAFRVEQQAMNAPMEQAAQIQAMHDAMVSSNIPAQELWIQQCVSTC